MRALMVLLALASWALAQTLRLPERAPAGEPLVLEGENLPQGRFPLLLEGPHGTETLEVEVREGRFSLTLTPKDPGHYRLVLSLPSGPLEARFQVLPPEPPSLTPDGLRLPWGLVPLPPGDWLGPLVEGNRVYVAQGLLVVEAGLEGEGLRFHFAPARIKELRPGPEALLETGRTLALPFPPLPFEGKEEDLASLKPLLDFFQPPRPWPYFAYWALDPKDLTPEDLAAYRESLRGRGHRPELFHGQEGVVRMAEAARALLREDPERARALAETLLAATPLFPNSLEFFHEVAEALEAQGHPEEALRYREALGWLKAWLPPALPEGRLALGTLAVAYLALLLYLFLLYLPAQLRDLKPVGGFLRGFFRHPLLRLRHLTLAYASLGERALALGLLLLLVGGVLLYGLDQRAREALFAPPLDRGTLATEAAQDFLRGLPALPAVKAHLGYALLSEAPKEAAALLGASGLPFALALKGKAAEAYAKAPWDGGVRAALGLGTDPWGERTPGPSARTLYLTLLQVAWTRFLEDPLRGFLGLSLPLPQGARVWAFLTLFLLLVYHLLAFFLPRPKGAPPALWSRLVRLLLPGSLGFSSGLGAVLLLLAAYGFWAFLQGEPAYLLLAYGIHLLLWIGALRRPA
ncbi:hypothetical protein GCM10007092_05000 [Thermus composti]|uniref:Uncharacterized protein n=1 Tax=Thermus composti TaxID=532059 RepID=A0ABV6Q3E9_9DEIN|nr:hypothetical protein [Thermus composti]GGM94695.1 hypothetical protein GCM10007092_05000 [Thermus composti]